MPENSIPVRLPERQPSSEQTRHGFPDEAAPQAPPTPPPPVLGPPVPVGAVEPAVAVRRTRLVEGVSCSSRSAMLYCPGSRRDGREKSRCARTVRRSMPKRESIPPRDVRLAEFFRRLGRRGPFSSLDEAYLALVSVLEEVEDELTGVENEPTRWKFDGRLYPPQHDNWSRDPNHPHVTRMRTRGHNVFIADNGAIEVWEVLTGVVQFSMPGSDGMEVWNRDRAPTTDPSAPK
jgi:hypothetical protein